MNIFQRIAASLRRKKKGKPAPVVPDRPIKAVTYNRVGGVVSGGQLIEHRPPLQQTRRGVVWDPVSKVHKGKTYDRRVETDDFVMYADATDFDDGFWHMSTEIEAERPYEAPGRSSGYDGYTQSIAEPYVDARPSYEAPTSTTTYDTGSSYVAPSYSGSSSSGFESSSSSGYTASDSGGSSGGGGGGE